VDSIVVVMQDKHSRKGLQDMVQRRKKYLKYLRRTDWDSYCMVLSKLGLRDIPEYKAPDYKKTQPTKAQSKKSKSKRKRKMKA
jgi:small subunit ribosomal protein S15